MDESSCYQGFSGTCTGLGTVSARLRDDRGELVWKRVCKPCFELIASERETAGRCAICFEADDKHDGDCRNRWRDWHELVPRDARGYDSDDSTAYEAAKAHLQGSPIPEVSIRLSRDNRIRTMHHNWPPRKISIEVPQEKHRLILARMAVLYGPNLSTENSQSNPFDEAEHDLKLIMASLTASERGEFQTAIERRNPNAAEEVIFRAFDRLLGK